MAVQEKTSPEDKQEWEKDCLRWRGKILTGEYSHWCLEWDFLPVDETTKEFEVCSCFKVSED